MTKQEIEIVAIAIREVFGNRSGRGCDWDNLKEYTRQQYRAEAEAAITALDMIRESADRQFARVRSEAEADCGRG